MVRPTAVLLQRQGRRRPEGERAIIGSDLTFLDQSYVTSWEVQERPGAAAAALAAAAGGGAVAAGGGAAAGEKLFAAGGR